MEENTIWLTAKLSKCTMSNSLAIEFVRTVRTVDNKSSSNLPPNLGRLPLYKVLITRGSSRRLWGTSQVTSCPCIVSSVPHALEPYRFRAEDNVEREAMWIKFTAAMPFAIKIYVGGVNAISGIPAVENQTTLVRRMERMSTGESIQDYVVTPKQLWLDGIVAEDGQVRQFVAMPFGTGYSVEAQIAGEDLVGGIQLEVTPSKATTKLQVTRPLLTNMSVIVRQMTGAVGTYVVKASTKVAELRSMVQKKQSVPLQQVTLVYGGKELNDSKKSFNSHVPQADPDVDFTMSDYGVSAVGPASS